MSDDDDLPPTSITWKPAGPYVVDGPVVIRRNDGTPLEPPPCNTPGQIKLCGCGYSKNKPFCDGSHKR